VIFLWYTIKRAWPFHFRDCKSGSIGMKFFVLGVAIFWVYQSAYGASVLLMKKTCHNRVKKSFQPKIYPNSVFCSWVWLFLKLESWFFYRYRVATLGNFWVNGKKLHSGVKKTFLPIWCPKIPCLLLKNHLFECAVNIFLNEKRNNCCFFRIPSTLWKNLATASFCFHYPISTHPVAVKLLYNQWF
jgi:hypothetical protein